MMPAETIIAAVCAFHNVQHADLSGPSRIPQVVWPRHEAVYLLRQMSGASFVVIGSLLGGRDGKTIQNSIHQVTRRAAADKDYAEHLKRLMRHAEEFEARSSVLLPLARARRLLSAGCQISASDIEACGFALLSAASILASPDLTDAEARTAVLQLIGK